MPIIAGIPAVGVGVASIQGMARATGRSKKAFMNVRKGILAMTAD